MTVRSVETSRREGIESGLLHAPAQFGFHTFISGLFTNKLVERSKNTGIFVRNTVNMFTYFAILSTPTASFTITFSENIVISRVKK